jgi:pyruvate-formate lyase-activating enzyme
MDKATYLAALKIAKEQEAHIALGGGEPTLHPEFWEYVGLALRYNTSDLRVFLVTNGANTEDALALAKLAQ